MLYGLYTNWFRLWRTLQFYLTICWLFHTKMMKVPYSQKWRTSSGTYRLLSQLLQICLHTDLSDIQSLSFSVGDIEKEEEISTPSALESLYVRVLILIFRWINSFSVCHYKPMEPIYSTYVYMVAIGLQPLHVEASVCQYEDFVNP